jgi:uncharacterized protein with ATP-grasp and redox domains
MRTYLDCLPCVLRQVLEASRISTDSEELQDSIMTETVKRLGGYKAYRNSPELCRAMHGIVKERTGAHDPYADIKQKDIQTALKLLPVLKSCVEGKRDRLYWALKAAATGNMLDSSISASIDFEVCAETELNKPFSACDMDMFKRRLKQGGSLLIIGDNAGETVADRILLEELPSLDATYAVRSAPIINDATTQDAYASGLDKYARIISTGCDVPGVNLDVCSGEFLDVFYGADIVISKGQGNYETLSECDRDIFFLLKAKCLVLARLLGVSLNDYVFTYHDKEEEKAEADL